MIKWILILSFFLPGCTYFIHNESYQFIDKSKTIYDASTLFTNKKSSTELVVSAFKKEPIRVTGFSCGNKLYSDYPCMEALGCIIVEDKSYAIFD
tara:strand:- start:621 stop:905 length:285 start_codon:yes stop_codon:yes gene_type:complete